MKEITLPGRCFRNADLNDPHSCQVKSVSSLSKNSAGFLLMLYETALSQKKTDSSEDVPWIPVTHRRGSPLPNASLAVILPACLPALFTTIMFNPPLNHNAAGQSSKCPTPAPITYGVAPGCPGHQDWISQLISVWGPDCHTVTWFPFGWGLGCSFYPDSGTLHRSMCGRCRKSWAVWWWPARLFLNITADIAEN